MLNSLDTTLPSDLGLQTAVESQKAGATETSFDSGYSASPSHSIIGNFQNSNSIHLNLNINFVTIVNTLKGWL